MRKQRAAAERRRTQEFEAFVGGAAGRLLHVALLLTGEDGDEGGKADGKAADQLLYRALSRTYLNWPRLRSEDPYAYTRQELVSAYARHTGLRRLKPRSGDDGAGRLSRLRPQERLVLVLRLYEGIADEQVAAQLGMSPERIRAVCSRASATLRSRPAAAEAGGGP